ncbi:hypothetical protein BOTBODRAFT_65401 [Botryobasidium botryosum FD-172 SS1]|uniref:Alpha/beta hydrolase fold-3 domain-containing protein n=1 Tax=Botryobasidium botryosum (strain FD-172 SS1) TaxID=930990 RepID=A0A067MLY6_BOTB1|nr:hypothetical protein BOTBODRAFT_65401 [Botryobasidium botryosum FD-172 SS1]
MLSSMLPWPFGDGTTSSTTAIIYHSSSSESPFSSLFPLLHHYDVPGLPPPSSRVDPLLPQRQHQRLSVLEFWRYAAFVARKMTDAAGALASHHIWGPRKASWGWEMSIVTSFTRGLGKHTHLTNVQVVRAVSLITGLIPLPSDALVTPVTFRVRKRNLRGFFAKYDRLEDGTRELTGEWIVNKRHWQRLQAASKRNACRKDNPIPVVERVVYYIHGGAYFACSAATHRQMTIAISKSTESRVFAINYRLAPETKFPGPLHDVVCGYMRLIEDLAIPAENIIVSGDSAGGGLSLGLLLYLRDNGYPLPGGAILMSPWIDLTMSCDSWATNEEFDVICSTDPDDHMHPVMNYLGAEGIEAYLTHPYASPLFGHMIGLPPLLIQSGTAECLRDENVLLAYKAKLAGVTVRHELFEDCVHVFQMFPFLAASKQAFGAMRGFVVDVVGTYLKPKDSIGKDLEKEMMSAQSKVVGADGEVEVELKGMGEALVEKMSRDLEEDNGSPSPTPSWAPSTTAVSPSETPVSSKRELEIDTRSMGATTSLPSPLQRSPTRPRAASHSTPTSTAPPYNTLSPSSPSPPRARNHRRTLTAASLVMLPSRPAFKEMTSQTPIILFTAPSTNLRERTHSHPDIVQLCKSWVEQSPVDFTRAYRGDDAHY